MATSSLTRSKNKAAAVTSWSPAVSIRAAADGGEGSLASAWERGDSGPRPKGVHGD